MNYRKLIQSDYIAADEFGGSEPTLTITRVQLIKFEDDGGKAKSKGVVSFKERDRAWILNRTNAECLAAMFGHETDGWHGKRVTLCAQSVRFGGETKNGIRIKGSPDLAQPVSFDLKLPKKKAQRVTLVPTTVRAQQQTQTQERQAGADDDK